MQIDYIKQVLADLKEVLGSEQSTLSKEDFQKLQAAAAGLEKAITSQGNNISLEDKVNYIHLVVLVMEIIKGISDHFK